MKPKQLKNLMMFSIILFGISLLILLIIGFDEYLNSDDTIPSFTSVVAILAGISFVFCCVITALTVKGKKKRRRKY